MKSISGKISHLEAEIKYDLELLPIPRISSEISRWQKDDLLFWWQFTKKTEDVIGNWSNTHY